MLIEYQFLLFFVVAFIMIVVFFVYSSSLKKKQLQEEQRLYKEIESLKGKNSLLQESIKKLESQKHDTTFVSEQIEKIKRLEEELYIQRDRVQDAKLIAQEANKVKYAFLTNVSHEIRTPMNSILVFAKLLVQELQDKKFLGYSKNIVQAGHKLLRILDDVIELSKIETGGFEVHEGAVDLNALFDDVVQEQKKLAFKKGLELSLEIDEELPVTLMMDAKKVKEIMHNLVGNALKFTENGYVKIRVKTQKLNVERNSVDIGIYVEDSGIGIEKTKQEQIFQIFENREDDTELESQGTGLGLSINKKMATLLNGALSVESQVSKGSTFLFMLYDVEIVLMSASDKEDDVEVDFSLVSPKGAKILVVDEDENSHTLISEAFKDTKIELFSFSHPREAIEMLKSQSVDLIFMDLDIFSDDESAVSKFLAKVSKAPVITLTNRSIREVSFVENGARVVGHLKKPISKVELFKLSIRELNDTHVLPVNEHKPRRKNNDGFNKLNKQSIKSFLEQHNQEISPLFDAAITTNDLNTIKKFAQGLLALSKKEDIVLFTLYAQELLEHIEALEIEAITLMLQEYKSKIKSLQSL